MKPLLILTLLVALFTLVVMLVGVTGMARGSEFNKKYGNKLMQLRVAGQAVTIILVALLAFSGAG